MLLSENLTSKNTYLLKIITTQILFIFLLTQTATAQIFGCTDPPATNYNTSATDNDGSCLYPNTSVSPVASFNLSNSITETSGLIKWNDRLWTHNDNSDINLYALDTLNGSIIQSYPLAGLVNNDWEEISQDSNYVYIGDFGNNVNGNRTNLKILRVEKNSILALAPITDTISFSYSDQTDFTPTGANNTDFDCEAFVVTTDSIYLFTKQWVSNKTSLYSLPKIPGNHVANFQATLNAQGLITGAVLLQSERIIALSGYTNLLQPFTWLLYDFSIPEFFGGNKRMLNIPLPFHQIEGITTSDGFTFYMSNEYFSIIPTSQKLHRFDFSPYLGNYLNNITQDISMTAARDHFFIYPNPSNGYVMVEPEVFSTNYEISSPSGSIVKKGILEKGNSLINISGLTEGMYFLRIGNRKIMRILVSK